jgi:Flp pilus assembly pilin Flp
MLKHTKKQKGQGMVEYIVIVALIGLASIAAFAYFGQAVRGQTGQMAEQIAGQNDTAGQTAAVQAAATAVTEGTTSANLSTYTSRDNF